MRTKLFQLAVLLQLAPFSAFGDVPREPRVDRLPSTIAGTLLADTEGSIETVVIGVNSARRSALRNAHLVTNIVNGLPPSTRISILTNDRAAFDITRNASPERVSFIELPADNPLTIWTQDPFLVMQSNAQNSVPTLLASKTFERAGDSAMAEHIAAYKGYQLQVSSLSFEGGNVVSDDEYILVGANTIRRNAIELALTEDEVVARFQEELGRPVLVVGPFPQPVGHIDMMITPLGKGRIAVADAKAGIRIAEDALANSPESVADFERYCEGQFFGHPSIGVVPGKDGQMISAPAVLGKTLEMIELSRSIALVLDGIAASFERYGYRVERVPFLFGGPGSIKEEPEKDASIAAYPMLTYNNVLITDDAVYLPRYGWPAMDEAAANAWAAVGFTPHPIDGLSISAMYGGALRCSVKVLERRATIQQP